MLKHLTTALVFLVLALLASISSDGLARADGLEQVGWWPYGSTWADIGIDEDRRIIYMGCGGVVLVLNASNQKSLTKIAEVRTPATVSDVVYLNSKLYIADGWNGLIIVDVSDPNSRIYPKNHTSNFVTLKIFSSKIG